MRKYYTNSPCNYVKGEKKTQGIFSLTLIGVTLFTLFRGFFHFLPINNDGLEEIAVMAFAASHTAVAADVGSLPTEDKIVESWLPSRMVVPLKGAVTSGYDQRKDPFGSGDTEFHKGIDISAAYDTRIVSFADGTVEKIGYSSSYGNYVLIRHPEGMGAPFETLYAHCEKILVSAKEKVLAGDEIAVAGSTGRSTGPHLHFEVRINGSTVDPAGWLELAEQV